MGAWNSKVTDIYNELNDWVNVRGGSVADLALSLINRARRSLWQEYAWDYLVKTHTFDMVDNSSLFPVDFGRLLRVYYSATNNGIADWYFSRNDRRLDRGYKIESTFSKEAGVVLNIKFNQTPSYAPLLDYVIDMPDCEAQTDFLFFPANLIYRGAQLQHIVDKPEKNSEVQAIQNAYDVELRNFIQAHQCNDCAMEVVQQDSYFNAIGNESYSLDGNLDTTFKNRSSSYDCG
jgi:hypothetical protein